MNNNMQTTIRKQSIKQELMILLTVTVIAFTGYWCAVVPHYLPTSKIEEGTIVVRNDSVTTIIIPDKR